MKRDMDLVRNILLSIEDNPSSTMSFMPEISGYSQEAVAYHIHIMKQDGLLDALPIISGADPIPTAFYSLTLRWEGHEFIDAARDEGLWRKAISQIQEKGAGAVTTGVLIQLLSSLAKQKLGLA